MDLRQMRHSAPVKASEGQSVDTFAAHNRPGFWVAVLLTGAGAGISAVALYFILEAVQKLSWPGSAGTLLAAVSTASPWHRLGVLLGAGLVVGAGQIVLSGLSSGGGIDLSEGE